MKDNWEDRKFATDWDEGAAINNPNRLALLELLMAIVTDNYTESKKILDLGCGSGLVEKQIITKVPNAEFVAIDGSEVMLAKARERLEGAKVDLIQHNLNEIEKLAVPKGDYQFAITSFVLHEIPEKSKKEIFEFIYRTLISGGVYILVDRFKIDLKNLKIGYRSQWNNTIHPEWKHNTSFDKYSEKMADKEDSPDTLEDQIQWLREIGFKADCLKLELDRALVVAIK